jgi:hypothetical protein
VLVALLVGALHGAAPAPQSERIDDLGKRDRGFDTGDEVVVGGRGSVHVVISLLSGGCSGKGTIMRVRREWCGGG